MAVSLELYELKNLCMKFSELGAANFAKRLAPGKDLISQRQAYREFQEHRVKRWVENGLVQGSRMGSTVRSKILYSRAELMAVDTAEKMKTMVNKHSNDDESY